MNEEWRFIKTKKHKQQPCKINCIKEIVRLRGSTYLSFAEFNTIKYSFII